MGRWQGEPLDTTAMEMLYLALIVPEFYFCGGEWS